MCFVSVNWILFKFLNSHEYNAQIHMVVVKFPSGPLIPEKD